MSVTRPILSFFSAFWALPPLLFELVSSSSPQATTNAAASTSAKMASARAKCDFTITELLFGVEPSLRRASLMGSEGSARPDFGQEMLAQLLRDERGLDRG